MRTLFWTGRLSLPVSLLVNTNNIAAWLSGNTGDRQKIKERVKLGYEGKFTDHVTRYDELSGYYQKRAAVTQIEAIDFKGKKVIDIGSGTGIMAFAALDSGASSVVSGDISDLMLEQGRANAQKLGLSPDKIQFCQLDAESLPFNDGSFEIVMTGMAFGLFPDQERAVREMYRVVRQGGIVSLGAHGPEHYWEGIEASIKSINKRYVLGYRFEFWPRTEKQIHGLMERAGFKNIKTSRFIWRNLFSSPAEACAFFSSVTSAFWYAEIPESKREKEYKKMQDFFIAKGINLITDDVIVGYGTKP